MEPRPQTNVETRVTVNEDELKRASASMEPRPQTNVETRAPATLLEARRASMEPRSISVETLSGPSWSLTPCALRSEPRSIGTWKPPSEMV